MKEKRSKCAKCGSSPFADPTIKLHRFPLPNKANKSRCELWAKFCFPDDDWHSPQFQYQLYSGRKMLCDRHFKKASKEKQLQSILPQENDHKKSLLHEQWQDSDTEIVMIKNELLDKVPVQENYDDLKRISNVITEIHSSPKKNKCEPLIKSTEESADSDDSVQNTNNASSIEPLDKTLEELDDSCDELFLNTSKYDQNDDCLLYGKLITKKLRTYSVYERNLLMYKIDGLLIENPPGFDKTIETTSINLKRKKSKRVRTSSAVEEHSNPNIDKTPLKRKIVVKESSQIVQMSSPVDECYIVSTQVTSTPMPSLSTDIDTINQPAKTNKPVKLASSIKNPVKNGSTDYQPIKATSTLFGNISETSKVTSSIPNKPVKVTRIIETPVCKATSLPTHVPLKITIPETRVVPITQSKLVPTTYPKGKIVIMKSKSSKYVPSSQPPILITVPSMAPKPVSTQCELNSLEQLSAIAATRPQTKHYQMY